MKNIIVITVITIITFIFPSAAFAQTATLSLEPASGTFNLSCSFSVNVKLDTGGTATDGSDAILLYDSSRITATSVTNGKIYPDYPGNNIDPSGKVTISGLASVNSPFSGKGTLATVNFTVVEAAPAGVTQITFDFDPNDKTKTTDSNVVERGSVSDVLNSVVNGSYTIGAGTCLSASPSPASTNDATGAGQPRGQTLDQIVDRTGKGAGTPEQTFAIAIVGGILTILGILGLALL